MSIKNIKGYLSVIIMMLLCIVVGYGEDLYKVTGVSFVEEDEWVKVVITTTAEPQYKCFTLEDPPRLVVDFLNAKWEIGEKKIPIKRATVYRIRSRQFQKEPVKIVRVVIDLERPLEHYISSEDRKVVALFRKPQIEVRPPPEEVVEELPPKEVIPEEIVEKVPPLEEIRVSLDFVDADILDVLRLIAQKAKINIVPSKSVRGRVTIRLHNVPWETALYMVLKIHGFSYVVEKGIVWVGTEEEIERERITRIIRLKFATGEEIKKALEPLLSEWGEIRVDKRTNSLVVIDIPEVVKKIEDMATKLDIKTPQVLIEAKIVEITTSGIEHLGIRWGLRTSGLPLIPTPDQPPVGVDRYIGARTEAAPIPTRPAGTMIFGFLVGDLDLDAELRALVEKGEANILSAPSVIVLNGEEAEIVSAKSIPFIREIIREEERIIEVEYRDVSIVLTVTPIITPDNHILLKVKPVVEDYIIVEEFAEPLLTRSSLTSRILVRDGDTIVIGGIVREKEDKVERKVPVLADIPLLGKLFRFRGKASDKYELLIFIHTSIVRPQRA